MTRWLTLGAVVLAATACVHRIENTDVRDVRFVPGVTTKEDVIRALGAPTGSRLQGEDTLLVFRSSEVNGSGYGIGSFAGGFMVEATHSAGDTVEVVFGPDRTVRSYRVAAVPHEHPVWPSDD